MSVRTSAILGLVILAGLRGAARADEVAAAVLEAEAARVAVMEKSSQAVVAIFEPTGSNGGSGVVITPDGYALTNFHVTKGAGDYMKCGLADGQLYDAVIVGIDPTGDVALIKLLGRDDFPTAELGDSDSVRVGAWAWAMGNPFLLANDFQPTCTYGIISGVHRYQYPSGTLLEYADCLQTDASINPGNSGGPLFNARGQLIGINGRGSFEKRGRVNVGVGYAISINQIKHFLGALRGGRLVDHATLGATVTTDDEGRVVVSNILESSDAYRRGLRHGDEIVVFAGRSITTVNAFKNALGIFPAGWRVPLTFRREGEKFTLLIRLKSVHADGELAQMIQGFKPEPVEEPKPDQKPGDKPTGEKPSGEAPAEEKPIEIKPAEEKPAPEEEPGEETPEKKPDGPRPQMPPGLGRPKAKPIPDEVKKLLEPRPGFANYHFNQVERARVWNAFSAHGNFAEVAGNWSIGGTDATGAAVQFELAPRDAALALAGAQVSLESPDELGENLAPEGSGGLLQALYLWRKLLVEGPENFGKVEYGGVFPYGDDLETAEMLIATTGGVECRFYFDPVEGWLVGLEMYTDPDQDPCEVSFGEYRQEGERFVPTQMAVRYGDRVVGICKLDKFALEGNAVEEAPVENP